MKIRTITIGFNLKDTSDIDRYKRIAGIAMRAKRVFEARGFVVQTVRATTQPWGEYFQSREQMLDFVREIQHWSDRIGIDYFNIGTMREANRIPMLYDIIKGSSSGFASVTISDDKEIDHASARETAKLMKRLSGIETKGFGNLRFAALFNTSPGTPFFPAAYHSGETAFAIGTENSDVLYDVMEEVGDIRKVPEELRSALTKEYGEIERIAEEFGRKEGIKYNGIDVSVAPSVEPDESVAYAFEKIGLGKFGEPGTLALAKMVTDAIKSLDVKKCGYCGLMLPLLEDHGLAIRNREGTFGLTDLLLYSAVCGTGLDTIPLPGNAPEEKLFALLLDIASLSLKLHKPLSARLMLIPDKETGEMTEYDFDYFVNSNIMKI